MAKKRIFFNNGVAGRAWSVLRMALVWARKGGVFNRRLIMDHLRLVPEFMKTLGQPTQPHHLPYGEHQLSFNDTPVFSFRLKTHRLGSARFHLPHIPCINPQVDSDQEDALLDCIVGCEVADRICDDAEDGINVRADEFIAKFYEQLKLQRQISYLQ